MQEVALNGVRWNPAPADVTERELAWMDPLDEALLAQFETLLPAWCTAPPSTSLEEQSSTSTGSIAATGRPASCNVGGAEAQGEAGWKAMQSTGAGSDAIVSNYTVHHARMGTVHVQHSSAVRGSALMLRTDDDEMRARLRDAMPAMQDAMTDVDGRGPQIDIES